VSKHFFVLKKEFVLKNCVVKKFVLKNFLLKNFVLKFGDNYLYLVRFLSFKFYKTTFFKRLKLHSLAFSRLILIRISIDVQLIDSCHML